MMSRSYEILGKRVPQKLIAIFAPLVASLTVVIALAGSAIAADIEVLPPKKGGEAAGIMISGEIMSGDDAKFRKIAAEYSDAFVLLDSEGGAISPAMDIGRTIKLRGYKTAVLETRSCASACALIWLAGSKRVVFEGGGVGFHASYLDTNGKKMETGVGNALVGLYLSQLGFGEKTVVFATMAPPDKILWLNSKTASMSGIEFDLIPDDSGQKSPKLAARQPAKSAIPPHSTDATGSSRSGDGSTADGSSAGGVFMADAKQTLRSPEDFVQALRKSGFQASVSYENKELPIISTNVGGEDIRIGLSDCNGSGCNYAEFIQSYSGVTDDEAYYFAGATLVDEQYSHPYWNEKDSTFSLYNYVVLGSDGITIKNLIDNMKYFVRDNLRLTEIIVKKRSEKK